MSNRGASALTLLQLSSCIHSHAFNQHHCLLRKQLCDSSRTQAKQVLPSMAEGQSAFDEKDYDAKMKNL